MKLSEFIVTTLFVIFVMMIFAGAIASIAHRNGWFHAVSR